MKTQDIINEKIVLYNPASIPSSMEDKKSKFLSIYANVPDKLRQDIIAVVDDKTYTWNTAYFEIKNETALGKKILKDLEATRII